MPDDLLVCPECGLDACDNGSGDAILRSEFLRKRMAQDLEELASLDGVPLTYAERVARLPAMEAAYAVCGEEKCGWYDAVGMAWNRETLCVRLWETTRYPVTIGVADSHLAAAELIAAHRKGVTSTGDIATPVSGASADLHSVQMQADSIIASVQRRLERERMCH